MTNAVRTIYAECPIIMPCYRIIPGHEYKKL